MNSRRSELIILLTLLGLGLGLYALRWVLFSGPALHNEMLRFFVGDIGFLCLQVALVTLILDRMLKSRERQAMLRKLNMVIGAFFSEVGTELLGRLAVTDTALAEVRGDLIPQMAWTTGRLSRRRGGRRPAHPKIDIDACDLNALKAMLVAEKSFLLGLLSNQSLLEHEQFTELLWAVTHLAEELEARPGSTALPDAGPDPPHRRRETRVRAADAPVAVVPAAPSVPVPVPVLARGARQSARSGCARGTDRLRRPRPLLAGRSAAAACDRPTGPLLNHIVAMLRMLPSVSLNQADLIPSTVATPSTVFRPISGMSYSSNTTPLSRNSATTASNCSDSTENPSVVFAGAGIPGRS